MTTWLRTPEAVVALGVSADFLKRNRDSHGGFFREGRDYVLGASLNASIRWNIDECRQRIHQQGRLAREAQKAMAALQQEGN